MSFHEQLHCNTLEYTLDHHRDAKVFLVQVGYRYDLPIDLIDQSLSSFDEFLEIKWSRDHSYIPSTSILLYVVMLLHLHVKFHEDVLPWSIHEWCEYFEVPKDRLLDIEWDIFRCIYITR
jgi:hypothetical protein